MQLRSNPHAPSENEKPPGPEERQLQPYYGQPCEGECQAQANSMGSWNPDGSWNQGRQKEAPWRTHPNFRWTDNDQSQPPPLQLTNYAHPPERQSNWSGRNQEGQLQLGYRNQDHTNWGSRNQNNPGSSYVPSHQMNNQGNYQSSQPNHQGNQGSSNQYNNHQGNQGNYRQTQGQNQGQ